MVSADQIAQQVVVPLSQVLFSASIEENIRFGRADAMIEEVRAAALAANAGFVDALPEGFSTQVRTACDSQMVSHAKNAVTVEWTLKL